MNINTKIPSGFFRNAFGVAEKLTPLKRKKDPVVAAFAGLAFGGVGLGIYLGTLTDFFVPWLMVIILMILGIPFGELPLFVAPLCWAFWGYRRVKASNAKLDAGGSAEQIVEAEVITAPPPVLANPKAASLRKTPQARLRQVDSLLKKGVLTASEHAAKRAAILAEL